MSHLRLLNPRVLSAMLALTCIATSASAELLVYEGFGYTSGSNLNGASGSPGERGFAAASVWNASSPTAGGFVQVKPYNSPSGVYLSDGTTINPFTGVYANLERTGNYVGTNDGVFSAGGVADHLFLNRQLAPSVTSTFQNGTKTYFSFVSARAYNLNPRAPSLAIGSGIITGNRGDDVSPGAGNTSREVIAVGGLTSTTAPAGSSSAAPPGSLNGGAVTSFSNFTFFRAQYYNSSGTRTGWSRAVGTVGSGITGDDLVGTAVTSSPAPGPAAGNNGYWNGGGLSYANLPFPNPDGLGNTNSTNGFAVYGYTGSLLPNSTPSVGNAYGNNQALVNITVGEIAWGAGTGGTDLVSFYVFHDKDSLSLAAFDAGKMTWDTGADTSGTRSGFNYVSMGGGRYFADEIRMGTTFASVAPVPEPGTVPVLLAGLSAAAAATRLGWRRRGTAQD